MGRPADAPVDATRRRLEEALARPEVSFVELAVEETAPAGSEQDLAQARAQAEALVSTPLLLQVRRGRVEAEPARACRDVDRRSGRRASVSTATRSRPGSPRSWPRSGADPENARFTWQGGVTASAPREQGRPPLDVEKTVDLVMAQALDDGARPSLPVAVTKPEVSVRTTPTSSRLTGRSRSLGPRSPVPRRRSSTTSASRPSA